MKTALLLVRPGAEHQEQWAAAFAAGLERHGWKAEIASAFRPSDLLVVWGVRRVDEMVRQRKTGGQICVLERGYLADRFQWSSVSFGGGLNGHGRFGGPFDDPSRWELYFSDLLRPWREDDAGDVLICGQVPGDASIAGVDMDGFYQLARDAFERQGFTVRFRPHPGRLRNPVAVPPLAADLATARCVVTYNSNSAVDAVLAGVPAVVFDRGGMAWPVAGHQFQPPPKPDRRRWAHRLAWCQWRLDEMAAGECWAACGHLAEQEGAR